jgi:hypothetical protein
VAAHIDAPLVRVDVHVDFHVGDLRLWLILVPAIALFVVRAELLDGLAGQVAIDHGGVVENPATKHHEPRE